MAFCADVISVMEMQLFTKIWYQIFFWFILFRASSQIRYSIAVASIVWNIPQKHHMIPAEVLPKDSEALFFRLFDFFTSCWEVKMIDFTEYILNFSTFQPRGGKSKRSILPKYITVVTIGWSKPSIPGNEFYYIYWFFSTFRLCDFRLFDL